MLNSTQFSEIADKIADSLPPSLRNAREEVREFCRERLREQLSKLDLVTREEFEVQQKVLARTRQKLDALEKQLANKQH